MPHLRTLVRDAVSSRLREAVPSVGGRVHGPTRMLRQFQPHDVPAIVVSIADVGSAAVTKVRPRRVRRDLSVSVDIVESVSRQADVEAALDAVALEVEAALADPEFLPFVAHEWSLSSSSLSSIEGEGGEVRAVLSTVFNLQVASTEGRPDHVS